MQNQGGKRVTETAVSLGAENLSQRITGIESRDEVGRLAWTFNGMLVRLEDSFALCDAEQKECRGKKNQCCKKFRALVVKPRTSGQRGPKS